MQRRVAITFSLSLVLCLPAHASQPDVDHYNNGSVLVTDSVPERPGANGEGAPGRQVYSYWAVAFADGGFCRARRYTYDRAEAEAYQYAFNRQYAEANGLAQLAQCPPDATTTAPPSPAELARDFWDVRHLPRPTLAITPDYAITGKPVYLRIGNPRTTTFDVANPVGPAVHITATSKYRIDWGDGSPPTTTTSQGGPWPHGDVTHVYDHAVPQATITVTQLWAATWTAGPGTGGSLDNLQTAGTLTLRVEQLQAVRNR